MKRKHKATLLSLALVPAAVAVADQEVKAQENEQSTYVSGGGSWTNPHYIFEGKPLKQRMAAISRVAFDTPVTYDAKNAEELKAVIYENLKQFNTEFVVHYTGETASLEAEWNKIFDGLDLDPTMQYEVGTLSSYGFGYKGTTNDVNLTAQIQYHTTAAQEDFVTSEVKRIAGEIFRDNMTDFEKVKAVNEYIALHTTYSTESTASPHAAYAILKEGKGVCQAYALLAVRLLKEANMETYYVTGIAGGGPHAWNLVKVDGEWYHLDTTWNDPVFSADSGDMSHYVGYGYFLIPDAELTKDHQIDAKGYEHATSNKYVALRGVNNPVEVGSTWYFANKNDDIKLYKVDVAAPTITTQKVSDTRVKYLVHEGGWLYFSNYSNGAWLYKMKSDGSELTQLTDFQITSLKIENNSLVYTDTSNTVHTTPLKDQALVDQEAADAVTEKIQQLNEAAPTYLEDVVNARKAYDALTAKQQNLVADVQKLLDAETAINQANEAITTVITAIAHLDEYAEDFTQQVEEAQKLYDALGEKQVSVTNKADLDAAQQKVLNNTQIATTLTAAINAIDVSQATYFTATTAARTQYDQLTAPQKKLIDQAVLDKLVAAEAQKTVDEAAVFNINYQLDLLNVEASAFKSVIEPLLVDYDKLTAVQKTLVKKQQQLENARTTHNTYVNKATAFEQEVVGLATVASNELPAAIQATNAKWNAFNVAQQAYVAEETKTTLTNYVQQIATDLAAAEIVQQQISTLNVADSSFVADVAAAKTAYNGLTETQQALVSNAGQLAELEQIIADIEAAKTAIEGIPATATADFINKYNAATAAYEKLSTAAQAHVSNATTYEKTKSDVEAANNVTAKIAALTQPYQIDAIENVQVAYSALSDLAKGLVTNVNVLQAAELVVKDEQDTIKADAVTVQIEALASVTAAFVANYEAADLAYKALTDDQKAKVANAAQLTTLAPTVASIKEAIAAITAVNENSSTFSIYKTAVDQATAKLAAVDPVYQVAVTNAEALTAAAATIQAVETLETAIGELSVTSSASDIAKVKADYAGLTDQQKGFISNYSLVEQLENTIAANSVMSLIAALNESSVTFIADVAQVEAAYNKLTSAQKDLVTNADALQQAITKASAIAESMKEVANVIQLIAQVDEESADFASRLDEATKAFADLTEAQQLEVTNAIELTTKQVTLQQYAQDAASFESQVTSIDTAAVTFIADVEAVNKAFITLNEAQRTFVATSVKNVLQQYVADVVAIRTTEAQLLALNALSTSYYAEVTAAQQAYDALQNYQVLLSTEAVQKLTDAQAIVDTDKKEAQAVSAAIASLTNTSPSADVKSARAAYNALTANQQQLVSNINVLAAIEKAQSNPGSSTNPGNSNSTTNPESTGTSTSSENTNTSSGSVNAPENTGSTTTGTMTEDKTPTPPAPVPPTPVQPTLPQVVKEGDTIKINVPIVQDSTKTEPIKVTASETVQITIPIKSIPQGQEGATVAFAIEQQDGHIKLQATINDEPAKFATYIEVEIADLPKDAVLLRIDENGNKIATPFVIKDGKHVVKTMTSGEFIVSTEEKSFGDVVKDGHKEYIEALAKRHIVLGASEENFDPNAGISRAQFATMVARAMGLLPEGQTQFKDVEGKWYADSVQALFEAGIVTGKSEASFDPGQTLTRQQATLMVVRLLEFAGVELPEVSINEVPFKDFANIPKNYQDAVAKVYALGIFSGKPDGTFNPSGELTRSQMAKVLYKTLELAQML